jgi:hypothetical protein
MLRFQNSPKLIVCSTLLALPVAIGLALPAQAAFLFTTTTKDAFNANAGATQDLLDDGSNAIFGAQPFGADVLNQTAPLTRGAGGAYQYTLADVLFNATDPLASTPDSYSYEAGPSGGNGVGQVVNSSPAVWGIDSNVVGASEGGINALKVTFAKQVSAFGVELFDFESAPAPAPGVTGVIAQVIAYSNGNQVFRQDLADGDGAKYFAGLVGTNGMTFDTLIYALGGKTTSAAKSNEYAAGNFSFGEPEHVPTPALLPGLVAVVAGARRRWKAAQ